MLTANDINELNTAAVILANGLTLEISMPGVPLEVAQALDEARRQMENLPEVIDNLNLSFDRFNTISSAVFRMKDLAQLAARPEMDDQSRAGLNDEFAALAKILAADAGRPQYAGPSLNLLNQGQAVSAARIIGYLDPVIANMGSELHEQKDLVYEAISETITFLGVITQCYPESEGAGALGRLITEARKHCDPDRRISTPAATLH